MAEGSGKLYELVKLRLWRRVQYLQAEQCCQTLVLVWSEVDQGIWCRIALVVFLGLQNEIPLSYCRNYVYFAEVNSLIPMSNKYSR